MCNYFLLVLEVFEFFTIGNLFLVIFFRNSDILYIFA